MPRMHTHTQMHTRVPDVIVMRTLLPGFSPVGRFEALALAPGDGVGAGLIAYGQLAVIMHQALCIPTPERIYILKVVPSAIWPRSRSQPSARGLFGRLQVPKVPNGSSR